MNLVTFIYIFRNRETDRVRNSLNSLAQQTQKNFEVIFVDYGSDSNQKQEIESLVKSFSFCRYVYNDTRGNPWNRSHAINTGIKLTSTPFIFTSDVDLIFHSSFVEKINAFADLNKALFFTMCYLPEGFDLKEISGDLKFPLSKSDTCGQALIPVNKLNEINGYDEFYCFWGKEDNDIENRLRLSGVKTEFYDKEIFLFHQWHPLFPASRKQFPAGWHVLLADYFDFYKNVIRRNIQTAWGKLFTAGDRPALKLFADQKIKYIEFNCSKEFISAYIAEKFLIANPDDYVAIKFTDDKSGMHENSRLGKFIKFLNRILKTAGIHSTMVSDFRYLYSTTYDVRDAVIYFVLSHRGMIKDYFLEYDEEKLTCIIIKK